MDMDDDDQFVLTRLKEEMLDVAEENIDSVLGVERRLISETILVDLDLTRHTLTIHCRANEDIVHDSRSAIYSVLANSQCMW
jgi:hypothetical protein